MREEEGLFLGLDSSNYTTSLALVDREGRVLRDLRRLLEVGKGERGLRQQEALFQHIHQYGEMMEEAFRGIHAPILAVAASTRPRPVEGSYMPVFLAGETLGRSLAASHDCPFYGFSHQEGHIRAAGGEGKASFHAFHMSGGTCELLRVEPKETGGYAIEIVGGSRDISFGQLLDRIGVFLGMDFPAGKEIDEIVQRCEPAETALPPVKIREGWIHLAGAETALRQRLTEAPDEGARRRLLRSMMEQIADTIAAMTKGQENTLLMGGVSESRFLRERLKERKDLRFGEGGMGSDNALGIALLGKRAWEEKPSR